MRRPVIAAVLACFALAGPARAQDGGPAEAQALREAGALEARGWLDDAEVVLRKLLGEQPSSVGGLFAFERVLRSQGRPLEVLPFTARYLDTLPTDGRVRYLRLRVFAGVDSAAALTRETESWIDLRPSDPEPYREASRLWAETFGPERALDLLRRGQVATGDPSLLAAEAGDLLLSLGRPTDAGAEWARAVGMAGEGGVGLLRRVRQIEAPEDRERVVAVMLTELERRPTTLARRTLAVRLALAAERPERALELSRRIEPTLERAARRGFLQDLVRWADDVDAYAVTLWALSAQREEVREGVEGRVLDGRIAQAALAAGDTAAATAAAKRLAEAFPRGSGERRRLVYELLRLQAGRASPADLRAGLEAFRTEFAGAPELDELAAVVAFELQRRGLTSEAEGVLAESQGPRTTLEHAYLLLETGEIGPARAGLIQAAAGLPPARATGILQLASLLGRLSGAGQAAVATAAVAEHRDGAREGTVALEAAAESLPEEDRPPVLAQAARWAEGVGAEDQAARIRARLVERHADASEAPEAALALARWYARDESEEGIEKAMRLLEDLIVRAPENAVVPAARRELERLKRPS